MLFINVGILIKVWNGIPFEKQLTSSVIYEYIISRNIENGFTHRFGIHQTVCKSYHTYFPTAIAISIPIGKKRF